MDPPCGMVGFFLVSQDYDPEKHAAFMADSRKVWLTDEGERWLYCFVSAAFAELHHIDLDSYEFRDSESTPIADSWLSLTKMECAGCFSKKEKAEGSA
ncbi:MAG: hypothetical protein ACAI35_02145 [Candidatus Methylacidiphilales bacterium]|nr:hypothetical protein [Candidatus Methylacidiphilales bacterium]